NDIRSVECIVRSPSAVAHLNLHAVVQMPRKPKRRVKQQTRRKSAPRQRKKPQQENPEPLVESAEGLSQLPGFLIVGIGASAGGVEALGQLLPAMPGEAPLAIVVVQHLAPEHDSLLPELLRKFSSMQVVQAAEDMNV